MRARCERLFKSLDHVGDCAVHALKDGTPFRKRVPLQRSPWLGADYIQAPWLDFRLFDEFFEAKGRSFSTAYSSGDRSRHVGESLRDSKKSDLAEADVVLLIVGAS